MDDDEFYDYEYRPILVDISKARLAFLRISKEEKSRRCLFYYGKLIGWEEEERKTVCPRFDEHWTLFDYFDYLSLHPNA